MPAGRPRKTPSQYRPFWVQLSPEDRVELARYAKELQQERLGAKATSQDALRTVVFLWRQKRVEGRR